MYGTQLIHEFLKLDFSQISSEKEINESVHSGEIADAGLKLINALKTIATEYSRYLKSKRFSLENVLNAFSIMHGLAEDRHLYLEDNEFNLELLHKIGGKIKSGEDIESDLKALFEPIFGMNGFKNEYHNKLRDAVQSRKGRDVYELFNNIDEALELFNMISGI
jgi:hypothetical protein